MVVRQSEAQGNSEGVSTVVGSTTGQPGVRTSLVGGDTPLALLLLSTGFSLSFLLVPFSISVTVLRSHLFDIDLLINRTLVYGSLTTVLVAVYFGGVVVLQRLLSPLVGEGNQLVVVASTLAIAALFNPLRRRIQAFIDRGFYRKTYDARRTLEGSSAKLGDETDLDAMSDDLVEWQGIPCSRSTSPCGFVLIRPPETGCKTSSFRGSASILACL